MLRLKTFIISAIAAVFLFAGTVAQSQVIVGIGVPPICPYGYFDYPPYDCAPYGYYGPDWFIGGFFIGAGPWFHGHRGFYGHVDNRFDPRLGYNGPLPTRGERPFNHFHANEARDGQGHVGTVGPNATNLHRPGVQGGYRFGGGSRAGSSRGGGHR
ncbi:MAG: hypothetical protein P4K80_00860 [Acidobacteriaceae bacterium]|nr:hypothetical protein [Acidobacteriaceae bacterium]